MINYCFTVSKLEPDRFSGNFCYGSTTNVSAELVFVEERSSLLYRSFWAIVVVEPFFALLQPSAAVLICWVSVIVDRFSSRGKNIRINVRYLTKVFTWSAE